MRRVGVLLLLAAAGLSAQVRLDSLDALAAKAKESVNLTLSQELLKMVSQISPAKGKDGVDLSALIAGLKSISVRQFEFSGQGQYKLEDLDPVRSQLTGGQGWTRIISVKEKDETAEIYTRTDQGRVVGLTIIAAEPTELAVISIDGAIDLAALAQMGGAFGIPDVSQFMPKGLPAQQNKQDKKGKEE